MSDGELPEITEVQRVRLRPGDSLVVHLDRPAAPDVAAMVTERVRGVLRLDASVPVFVLGSDASLEVLECPLSLEAEITRVVNGMAKRGIGGRYRAR